MFHGVPGVPRARMERFAALNLQKRPIADNRHPCGDRVQAIHNFLNSAFVTDGLFVKRQNNNDIHLLINPQINNTNVETIPYPVNFYDCLRDI